MQPVVILGAGAFGREALALIEDINADHPTFDLLGLLDDSPSPEAVERTRNLGYEVLGGMAWLDEQPPDVGYVIAIANPTVKALLAGRFAGRPAPVIRHPQVSMHPSCRIGEGTIIAKGVEFMVNCQVGRHCHLNQLASIGHDTDIRDYCTIYPLVAVSGEVVLEEGVQMGANSTVLQGLTIGAGTFVGAGACVVKSAGPGLVLKGVPAR